MTHQNKNKLNLLINLAQKHPVMTTRWLHSKGFGYDLINQYRVNNWLDSIGRGVVTLKGAKVNWIQAVYAIQSQLNLKIHIGGKTALNIQGIYHYIPLKKETVYLFGEPGNKIPSWFKKKKWAVDVQYSTIQLFSNSLIQIDKSIIDGMEIDQSSRERAMMETLHFIPQRQDFDEASKLMQGLATLRPAKIQKLLEQCESIKVKRLFMFLAELNQLPWIKYINKSKINFGKGKRQIIPDGKLDPNYLITVPNSINDKDSN